MHTKMKKIFVLLAATAAFIFAPALSPDAKAQTPITLTKSKTTLTNIDTSKLTTTAPAFNFSDGTFQVNVTKTSGTVAGTVVIQGSLDGVFYTTVNSLSTALTDATNQYYFELGGHVAYHYWRARVITTGTSVIQVDAGYAYFRRKQ